MKNIVFFFLLAIFISCATNKNRVKFYYENPKIPLSDWEVKANKMQTENEITLSFVGKKEDEVVLKSDEKPIKMETKNFTPNEKSNIFFYQFQKPEKEISFSINGNEIVIPKENFQKYLHIFVQQKGKHLTFVYLTHKPSFMGENNFNYSKKLQ